MDRTQIIESFKQTAANVLPKGSILYLYGSRARGDYNESSDWDLLLLLDKPEKDKDDWDNYAWPFVEAGLDNNEVVSVQTYTKDTWFNGRHSLFFYNVEEDKEVLYES